MDEAAIVAPEGRDCTSLRSPNGDAVWGHDPARYSASASEIGWPVCDS
jgi:hypothetical protein